ncbi:MAG: hypothetical protein COB50_01615 [Thiotrichales bacterium]|nr:MAG: hypothetical protein COB50_01615 [Thiotrichales bacterium]
MIKIFKWALRIIITAVLLLTVTLAGLAIFVNPNDFKPQITDFIKQQTGQEIALQGDISWSIWPSIALEVNGIQHGQLHIKKALLNADIAKLLQGQLVIKSIRVEVPALRQEDKLLVKDITLTIRNLKLANNAIDAAAAITFASANNTKSSIAGPIVFNNGILTAPLIAKLGASTHKILFNVDTNTKEPKIKLDMTTKSADLSEIWQAFSQQVHVTGIATINIAITTQGVAAKALKRNLAGTANILIANGQLHTININEYATKALAGIGKIANSINNSSKTKFSRLSASCNITDGIVRNKNLLLVSKKYNVSGRGVINLPSDLIAYQVQLKLLEQKDLKNIPIPVKIQGKLDQPSVQVDSNAFVNNALQSVQKDTVKKYTNKLLKRFLGS